MSNNSFYTVIVSCDRQQSNYLELSSDALDKQGSSSVNNIFGLNQNAPIPFKTENKFSLRKYIAQ